MVGKIGENGWYSLEIVTLKVIGTLPSEIWCLAFSNLRCGAFTSGFVVV